MQIDRINAKILKELLRDGRKSFTEIAELCNTSKEVIANRYKQMKRRGIIVGATIQNSCVCYDRNLVAYITIYTKPHNVEKVITRLTENPNVIEIYRGGINPSMISLLIMKNIEELEQAKQSIKQLLFCLRSGHSIVDRGKEYPR